MQRLLEMVYLLYEKKRVTAKELAEHFEVSQRTIYRDIDILSASGIPIYANPGNGGGIRLLDNYVIRKSMLSEKEQIDILASLQGMKALHLPDIEPIFNKLATLFEKKDTSWLEVDFSNWSHSAHEQEKFNLLTTAIVNKYRIEFDYYRAYSEKTNRVIEPLKLLFKRQAWYVYGFCLAKNEYRMFKVTRIRNLVQCDDHFTRNPPEEIAKGYSEDKDNSIELVLKIESQMAHRVYDEFNQEAIIQNPDGSFIVKAIFPEKEWVYNYIQSFGDFGEVLAPGHVRKIIRRKLENTLEKYF